MTQEAAEFLSRANAWHLLKGLRPRPIELDRAGLIRSAPLDDLRSGERMAQLLLALGLNDEGLGEFPVELHPHCGQGLLIWQFPIQFGPYLAAISRHQIDSYLEIGVRHGGSFVATVEVLRRFDPTVRAVGVDIIPSPSMSDYARANGGVEFACLNTLTDAFAARIKAMAPIGLVFIDSHHEEAQCRTEFERVAPYARMIALHDIANTGCPGVGKVWTEIVRSGAYECHEFVEQYQCGPESYMGIGLAIRKQ